MHRTTNREHAERIAAREGLRYGWSVFASGWFVGTEAELRAIGCIDTAAPTTPPKPIEPTAPARTYRDAIRRCIAVLRSRSLCVQVRPVALLVLRSLLRRRREVAAGRMLSHPYAE